MASTGTKLTVASGSGLSLAAGTGTVIYLTSSSSSETPSIKPLTVFHYCSYWNTNYEKIISEYKTKSKRA